MMVPSLATRPPLVQPEGVQVQAVTHPVGGPAGVKGPIDQILINQEINRGEERNNSQAKQLQQTQQLQQQQLQQPQQQQQVYNQRNGDMMY